MSDEWFLSLGLSTFVSSCLLWIRGPWLVRDPVNLFSGIDRQSAIHVPIIAVMLYLFNDPYVKGLDYQIHHAVNAFGITWCYWRERYHGFLENIMLYEFSTPWLALYMITKCKWFTVPLVITYMYYRLYNTWLMLVWVPYADPVAGTLLVANMGVNLYWFTKILRKCYVKLLQ